MACGHAAVVDDRDELRGDLLAEAAESAWDVGIVVVVAGGNAGFGSASLNDPAYDPRVIAVGADDPKGTVSSGDDVVASFSSVGDSSRTVDVIAPGTSIESLKADGSLIDTMFPGAEAGTRWFRGSGTSQAAAVTSGAVALLLQEYPSATPDQIKKLLRDTATVIPNSSSQAQGTGLINLSKARTTALPSTSVVPPGQQLGVRAGDPRHHPRVRDAVGRGRLALRRQGHLRERTQHQRCRPRALPGHHGLERRQLERRDLGRQRLDGQHPLRDRDVVEHDLGWNQVVGHRLLGQPLVGQPLDRRRLAVEPLVGRRLVRQQLVQRGLGIVRDRRVVRAAR
jgi:hypothetical protein